MLKYVLLMITLVSLNGLIYAADNPFVIEVPPKYPADLKNHADMLQRASIDNKQSVQSDDTGKDIDGASRYTAVSIECETPEDAKYLQSMLQSGGELNQHEKKSMIDHWADINVTLAKKNENNGVFDDTEYLSKTDAQDCFNTVRQATVSATAFNEYKLKNNKQVQDIKQELAGQSETLTKRLQTAEETITNLHNKIEILKTQQSHTDLQNQRLANGIVGNVAAFYGINLLKPSFFNTLGTQLVPMASLLPTFVKTVCTDMVSAVTSHYALPIIALGTIVSIRLEYKWLVINNPPISMTKRDLSVSRAFWEIGKSAALTGGGLLLLSLAAKYAKK